jgi:hypothetical protein
VRHIAQFKVKSLKFSLPLKGKYKTKEKNMNKTEKKQLKKDDLVNDLDRVFYDIKNIEDQSMLFRLILRQFNISKLTILKDFIKHDFKTLNQLRGK